MSQYTVSPGVEAAAQGHASAAFFDLDNTLIHGSALFQIARGMVARGLVTRRQIALFSRHQVAFRLRGERMSRIDAVTDAVLALAGGQSVLDLEQAGEEIYDRYIAHRLVPQAVELVNTHLDAGHRVWLATAAPVELASIIAKRLRLNGAFGTVCEQAEGRFTGRITGSLLHGPAKADAVSALLARENLLPSACYAYSDSINDLPMLSLVGYPAAVNPDRRLRKVAQERYWPVYDFRRFRPRQSTAPGSPVQPACDLAPVMIPSAIQTSGTLSQR